MALKRTALGRGLDSLISMDDVPARGSSAINEIDIDLISPNPDQPRTSFDEEALQELATSIRELGIIQPVSLRKTGPESYQIIAGERRYRAARLAGLKTLPAYIRTASEAELTEMALIENIQREDLNAIEIALTFRKLMDQYNLTQERLSERVGKKRTTIANFIRLLKLPAEVQLGLRDKRVDMGHARALLAVDDPKEQLRLYNRIVREDLSVRRIEELIKEYKDPNSTKPEPATKPAQTSNFYAELQKQLADHFHSPVKLQCNSRGAGKITIPFTNREELTRLMELFDTLK